MCILIISILRPNQWEAPNNLYTYTIIFFINKRFVLNKMFTQNASQQAAINHTYLLKTIRICQKNVDCISGLKFQYT